MATDIGKSHHCLHFSYIVFLMNFVLFLDALFVDCILGVAWRFCSCYYIDDWEPIYLILEASMSCIYELHKKLCHEFVDALQYNLIIISTLS